MVCAPLLGGKETPGSEAQSISHEVEDIHTVYGVL